MPSKNKEYKKASSKSGESKQQSLPNHNKGRVLTISITDMTDDGKGIGHADGLAIFVPGSIPGDLLTARVTQDKSRYALAEIVEILEPSDDRTEPLCPYFDVCGGCALQSMRYEAQKAMKTEHVRNKLGRIGGFENPTLRPMIAPAETEMSYRNKAVFAIHNGPEGAVVGFRRRGSHRVVDVRECCIQKEPVMAVADAVRQLIDANLLTIYREPKNVHGRGRKSNSSKPGNRAMLREVTVKACEETGEMMVVLTVTGKELAHAEEIVYTIDDAIHAVTEEYSLESVVLEVKKGDIHDFAKDYIPLAGKRTILDRVEISGRTLDFEISAPAFYQVNTKQMVRLYEKASEYAELEGDEVVFDLYCGIGTIGLSMADRAAMIVGIEEVPGAVLDANRNAVINGIVNARYYTGRAEDILPRILDSEDKLYADYLYGANLAERRRVVVLDPPRGGCAPELLETAASIQPERIVYISCDAGTLARDLRKLQTLGYVLREVTPVEMFPQTMGVEACALLVKASDSEA